MTNNANTDHITGLSFDTHYAAMLETGRSYARVFDARPRKLVRLISNAKLDARGSVALVWEDTAPGKCEVVKMVTRYFVR